MAALVAHKLLHNAFAITNANTTQDPRFMFCVSYTVTIQLEDQTGVQKVTGLTPTYTQIFIHLILVTMNTVFGKISTQPHTLFLCISDSNSVYAPVSAQGLV